MLEGSDTAVLLGAGASKEAGVPTTFEVTEKLVERINSTHAGSPTAKALHFVCGALLAHDAADGANPFATLDVERVFAAVELLGERETYRALARVLLKELRDLVATHPKDCRYLEPLAAAAERDGGLTIATLNYDLAIEQAAANRQVQCATGVGALAWSGSLGMASERTPTPEASRLY